MLSINQIEEIKEQAYMGVPSVLEGICQVHPFTIKEIVAMGSGLYNSRLELLLLTENAIAQLVKEKTGQEIPIESIEVLEYLLQSAANDDMFLLELEQAFSTFIQEDILLLPKINAVSIGPIAEKRLITKDNFRDFQDILRLQNRKTVQAAPPKDETPGQRKMRLLRERVAEAKKKQKDKKGQGQSLSDLLEIATVFGIDINNCTLYAFYGLIRRHQMREKWNQDLQMMCAGADSKAMNAKYWGESPEN